MLTAQFRPLSKPVARPKSGTKRCPFDASWANTLDVLERELGHLRARDIIIEADFEPHQIRNDGWPRSSQSPRTHGVRLSFESAHGPLSYECATYAHYENNIRAIALTLERLRAVERYGAVKGGEQYRGWSQLPPGRGPIMAGEWATAEDAARFLLEVGQLKAAHKAADLLTDPAALQHVYRAAARATHPDAGGSDEAMARVNRAKVFIEAGRKEVGL